MAINPDEDTEFNDALRKHGILPPRPPTPPSPSPPQSASLDDLLDDFEDSELKELADDTHDEATQRLIDDFRQQKLDEARNTAKRARFGRVYPIGRDDYTREVTEASQVDEEDDTEGRGTPVVCFLYKDGLPQCERAREFVQVLAARHPRTKFVSIIGDKCIPNLPDSRLPMFIIYRKGDVVTQLVSWSARREGTIDELTSLLAVAGAIDLAPQAGSTGLDKDEEEVEDEKYWRAASKEKGGASSDTRRQKGNIRNSTKKDDSDSDFEFDL